MENESSVKVIPIDESTWSFEEEGVRFFLLTGTEKALLIDSGMTTHNAKELAESLTDLPLELLNTHADIDHIGSNGEFEKFYLSPDEFENYRSSSKRSDGPVPIREGDRLNLGDRELEIIALPGHTSGSIAVLDVKNRRLFSGDPVQDGTIFMFGPERNMERYCESLKGLEERADEFDALYPSHGSSPIGTEMIEKLEKAGRRVMADELPYEEGEMFGFPVKVYDVGVATFLCDK